MAYGDAVRGDHHKTMSGSEDAQRSRLASSSAGVLGPRRDTCRRPDHAGADLIASEMIPLPAQTRHENSTMSPSCSCDQALRSRMDVLRSQNLSADHSALAAG